MAGFKRREKEREKEGGKKRVCVPFERQGDTQRRETDRGIVSQV